MNRKLIISLMLSAALFAPQAQAMSGRVSQVVAMVMKPSLRNAVTQGERTIFSAARNGARIVPEVAQEARQPMAQNVSRSFAVQAPRAAQSAQRSKAQLAAGVGLAGAIGGAVTYVQGELPKDFLIKTDKNTILKMMKENPDYARQFAELINDKNFKDINHEILHHIISCYPESAKELTLYAVQNIALLVASHNGLWFLRDLMKKNPESAKAFMPYAIENIASLVASNNGMWFLSDLMSNNPESAKGLTPYAVQNIASLVTDSYGVWFLSELMRNNPESAKEFTPYIGQNIASLVTDSYGVWFLSEFMRNNPESAKEFTPYIGQNIASLLTSHIGFWFLEVLMENNSELAKGLTPYVGQNLAALVNYWQGRAFLNGLMKNNPESAKGLTQYAVQNIASLVASDYGMRFLKDLMEKNPASAKELTPYAVQNIASLVTIDGGVYFLSELMDKNPESAQELTPYILENVSLVDGDTGFYVLRNLIKKNPEAGKALITYVGNNIASWVTKSYGSMLFVTHLMNENREAAKELTPYAVQNFASLVKEDNGIIFLTHLMNENPQAARELRPYAVKNIALLVNNDATKSLLVLIANSDSQAKKAFLAELSNNEAFKKAISTSLSWEGIFYRWLASDNLTPTEKGLLFAISKHKHNALKDPIVKDVIQTVINLEKKYQDTHYTFTHGRNARYAVIEKVYRAFMEQVTDDIFKDFKFVYTKKTPDNIVSKFLHKKEEEELRCEIIKGYYAWKSSHSDVCSRQLFMNTSLFSNIDMGGNSSFQFMIFNRSVFGLKVSIREVFKQFDQEYLYKKYASKFEELESEYQQISKHGNLLVIAVPKETVGQYVTYVDWQDGHKYDANGRKYMVQVNGIETDDVKAILEARRKDPSVGEGKIDFTLAMTDTAGLDPKSGIKIHSLHSADREALAAWEKKFDALMSEVGKDFKVAWDKKVDEARKRNEPIYDALKPIENSAIFNRMKNAAAKEQSK